MCSCVCVHVYICTCVCLVWGYIHIIVMIVGVHEMHGQMHPNYCQITILLVVDLCSSLAYFIMTQPLPIPGKLPIKLGTRQLPTNTCAYVYMCTHTAHVTPYQIHTHCTCACMYIRNTHMHVPADSPRFPWIQ